MFRTNFADSACLRCGKIVYPTDKIGPLKDYAFFHSGCFRCIECGSKLTLKTYFNNQHCQDDKEVYCSTHVPKIGPGKFDGESMGIKTALNVPKSHTVNEQIRPGGKATFDAESLAIKIAKMHVPSGKKLKSNKHKWGRFDTSALHIQHALKATEVQRKYSKPQEKSIETYLDREEQVELENIHREEEDRLYIQFQEQRKKEESEISNVIEEEWEVKLGELTAKFEKELNRKKNKEDHKLLTKKESVARKLLEQERAATAELVDRHSEEMMTLIQEKKMEKLGEDERVEDPEESRSHYPAHPPPPMPPTFSKAEIYKDPTIFAELVAGCDSDVEKARSIFRWITVKNLNSIMFEESERGDTPMGLLRGIKFGTESYHVLFKRLCSYAGLHCVVIKGFSKSAGYQPGISFEDNRFRNSWNAVFVAGSWRFVQCNWGARHLVNAKEVPKPGRGKSDSLRYEYDDHYFLTDSKEYRLGFPSNHMKSVMHTDSTGAATVRLEIPKSMEGSLIFHYNIKFYSDDKDNFDGTSLKRYVMQSVIGNIVAFRYLTGEPMKFKSVCKFKIMCAELQTVMVPLPDCASGEWGPAKAMRLFGLEPLSHKDALVFSGLSLDIKFAMTRPLTDFMATLHKNGFEEKSLTKS
ncbi:Hillarin [Lepeophtheirus salmonis]|uniref:Hillarin n=1 Tax=Lepeophtheirus salmonis TaxID=72036 RepID=A0A7R8CWE5_LEPSM|nr:Hillarin [Lepeophtheirus salmonis]CAF2952000.1 Hillarin [Lepeophtheirus salmonis]